MSVKFIFDNWMLVAVAVASGSMLLWPLVRKGTGGPWVSTARAVELINREDALVLDVRDPGEYGAGHILGAKNLALARIEEGGGELAKRKERPVIVYCDRGQRSRGAIAVLGKQGFERVYVLRGGFAAWREAGLPVQKAPAQKA